MGVTHQLHWCHIHVVPFVQREATIGRHLDFYRKVLLKLFSCPYFLDDHIKKPSDRCHLIPCLLARSLQEILQFYFCYSQVAGVCPE